VFSRFNNRIARMALEGRNKRNAKGKTKVFCIGRNKTGTTSLKRAFEDLGYPVGSQRKAEILTGKYYFDGRFQPIVDYCKTAQVFQDVPFSYPDTYKYLDRAYPGSKFILTVRDSPEQWYSSITRFHAKLFGKEGGLPTVNDLKNAPYVWPGFMYNVVRVHGTPDDDPYNKELMIEHYEKYNKEVINYFKDRPEDLLVINISDPSSYSKFIDFLGIDSPFTDFPWKTERDTGARLMESMNRKISSGVLWNLASLVFSKGASTIFMLFLARLLAPEAFGLVAMTTLVFELSGVFVNSGLGAALIQSKEVSQKDLDTVFYSNITLSIIAYFALFVSAPWVAEFYNQSELTALVRVMGLVVLINAFRIVQVAVLSREMDFRLQMKANVVGVAISGFLAVYVAWLGWGVWSLVVQLIASSLIGCLIIWFGSEWRPSLHFSFVSFKRLFKFGRNLLLEGFLSVLYQNSYVLVIGRYFSAEITGLYYFAKKINNTISQQLTGAVQKATFPALSTMQDDDKALLDKYQKIMQIMIFIIAPIMALLGGLAPRVFELAFGEQWAGSVPYFQMLCIVGALYPLHALNINLLNVKGRPDLVLKVGLIKKAVNLTLLLFSIRYGVLGIVLSQVLGSLLSLIPNAYYSKKLVGYSLFGQLKDSLKPFVAASLAGYVAYFVAQIVVMQPIVVIFLASVAGLMAYGLVSALLKVEGARMIWLKAIQ
jgi:O-antigen/teichoic acid export membrane protein